MQEDFLAAVDQHLQNINDFARSCISSNYTLYRGDNLTISAVERIDFKSHAIEIELAFVLANMGADTRDIQGIKLLTNSRDVRTRLTTSSLELGPFASKKIAGIIECDFQFAMRPQALYLSLRCGEKILALVLPIGLNKLVLGTSEDPKVFNLTNSLAKLVEIEMPLSFQLDQAELCRLFPGATRLNEETYGAKIVAGVGSFYLII